jgi:hypothetical protein
MRYRLLDPITMVKIASTQLVLALLTLSEACQLTCSTNKEQSGRCYYNCVKGCDSLSATSLRNSFLVALQDKGFDCGNSGTTGLSCAKTSRFGACGTHKWYCGNC